MMKTEQRHPIDWREGRRLRAVELHQQGWWQKDIAAALGVTEGAVSQWLRRAREGGVEALYRASHKGQGARLTVEQRRQLPDLLARGAEAYGFRGDLWTRKRIAVVISREFRVHYHPDSLGRILRSCGWTVQKPITRARQRNEEAIREWRDTRWREIKKGRNETGARSSL